MTDRASLAPIAVLLAYAMGIAGGQAGFKMALFRKGFPAAVPIPRAYPAVAFAFSIKPIPGWLAQSMTLRLVGGMFPILGTLLS